MTDIHKLHIDLLEEHSKEWITGNGQYQARWKDPSILMYAEILKEINLSECLLYHVGCVYCSQIIFMFSQQTQQTIESLERRITELEKELNERQ